MTGITRIRSTFDQAKREHRAAFMPYHAMGYPDRATTLEVISALAEAGADLFEIGIPHSDPLADGPTIQTATVCADQGHDRGRLSGHGGASGALVWTSLSAP